MIPPGKGFAGQPSAAKLPRLEAAILAARKVGAQELDPDAENVVICHHGGRSMHVAMFLERQGYSNVYNLTGGVDAWARQVDKAMPTY